VRLSAKRAKDKVAIMQQEELVFSGFGGQGVMFVGQLLAYAAMDEGLNVTWIPSYGPEMRGGTAHCFVVISDQAIGSPLVRQPKVAVVFNNPSFEKYDLLVAPGGLLALNASMISSRTARTDIAELALPATDLADELGALRLANVAMLGGVLAARPVLLLEAIERALEKHIPAHRRDMLDLNVKALYKGAEFAHSLALA
jgi:2-oxoglutarate ferredoxin oxidoreductase subunit gamma